MGVGNQIKGRAINAYIGNRGRRAHALIHDITRRFARRPRRVDFYFQVDDPYSYLLAQLLPELTARHQLEFAFHLVPPPEPDMNPEPERRTRYAVLDARALARRYQVDFPTAGPESVAPAAVVRANQLLARSRSFADQVEAACAVGDALWRGDDAALAATLDHYSFVPADAVATITGPNRLEQARRGHYMGAMLYYLGDWYWGVDRLHYLEERLAAAGSPGEPTLRRRPHLQPGNAVGAHNPRLTLDYFFSFRSPYAYLALARTLDLAERYPLDLRIKPVLPMVMRKLKVPRAKTMYIVFDAKREADRLGIPFGRICDPVGLGVERCMAIFAHADAVGRGREFLLAATRGIWAEALDVADDGDLARIVASAGLDWSDACAALADSTWRAAAEANRSDLLAAGMWGVPSYRLGSYIAWGQDRLELLEDEIRDQLHGRQSQN